MSQRKPIGRRRFIREAAAGGAGLTAVVRAPAFLSQRSPNTVVGLACIGVGTQGHRLLREAQSQGAMGSRQGNDRVMTPASRKRRRLFLVSSQAFW